MSDEQRPRSGPEKPRGWDYSSDTEKAGGAQIIGFIICAVLLALTPVAWLLWLWLNSPQR
ncbi:MAG: hypothetical protein ACK47B_03840 [Armatimonadota bacterium]